MITDRTREDVERAKQIRMEKIQKFIALSDEEKEILTRGSITIDTLNRIEIKQEEVKNKLFDIGYSVSRLVNKTDWEVGDFFMKEDLERVVENNAILRNAFYVFSDTPWGAEARYYYEDFNNIEKILVDLEKMLEIVKKHARECDTFFCGE